MIFRETPLPGAWVIEPERLADHRGFFARTWCSESFAAQGLSGELTQISLSFNQRKGTLRGMHYQAEPYGEVKLIRCTMGTVYDVIIDLRPDSPTYKQYFGVELSAENRWQLYVPVGCAHGFQTLAPNSEVLYHMNAPYVPHAARGVRWNDPAFAIDWPTDERTILDRDQHYPLFEGQ